MGGDTMRGMSQTDRQLGLALQICDQCNIRRVKCSRQQPSCDHCTRRGDSCTYYRKTRKNPRMSEHPDFFSQSSVFHSSGLDHIPRAPPKNRSLKIRMYQPLATARLNSHRSDLAIRIVHEWPFQGWISFLMVTFNFPMLESCVTPETDMFLTVFSAISTGSKSNARPPSPSRINPFGPNAQALSPYLMLATHAYFKYVNPFLPLFTQQSFGYRRRSKLMMLTIWASGMIFLPQESTVKHIQNYLHDRLLKGLKKNYHKVSFEMLQILLVILHGLQHISWALNSAWLCCSLTLNIAYALGLHETRANGCPVLAMERQMAYTNIIYFNSVRSWLMDAGCNFYTDHTESDGGMDELTARFPLDLHRISPAAWGGLGQADNALLAVQSYTALAVSDCQRKTAHVLIGLRELRSDIRNGLGTCREALTRLLILQNRLKDAFLEGMTLIERAKSQILSFPPERHTALLDSCILAKQLMNLHYQSFYKDTVRLLFHFHKNLNLPPASQPIPATVPIQIEDGIDASIMVIRIDASLGLEPYSGHRITTLGKAIIFLIQYQHLSHKNPSQLNQIIQDARTFLAQLGTVPSFKANCFFTSNLVDLFAKKVENPEKQQPPQLSLLHN